MSNDKTQISTRQESESLEDFKNSFSYGSRSDMLFKFLKGLSEDEAGLFLQQLLKLLGDTMDDGDIQRIVDHIYQGQAQIYDKPGRYKYEQGPFIRPEKLSRHLRIALMTTSGHFVAGDDPEPFGVKDMSDEEAEKRIIEFLRTEPRLSGIPIDTPGEQLRVRHGGYDVRGTRADPNVTFPLARLQELQDEGILEALHPTAYSFVGACSQTRLLKHTGPQWVQRFLGLQIEALILVPV